MYPFKITWATESLKEFHEDDSYGYADDLFGIKKEIYKYIDQYICWYKSQLEYEIKDRGYVTLHRFFEMVNSEPYSDSIFLDIKYFDFSLKKWKDYEVDEVELEQYFLSQFESVNV